MKHVLTVTDHLGNVGGAELSARTIIAGLAAHKAVERVSVVGLDLRDASRLDFGEAEVVPVRLPGGVASLPDFAVDLVAERRLAAAVRDRAAKADIIHAHHRRSTLALSRIDTATPAVATVRDFWPACPISIYHVDGEQCTGCDSRLDDCVSYQGWDGIEEPAVKAYLLAKRRHQRPALAAADCGVFIAKHLRHRLAESVRTPDRTAVVYNPVEIPETVEPAAFDTPTFVTASSLTEAKGIGTAIRAMDRLIDEVPGARLLIFGDGPDRSSLERYVDDLVPNAVEFRGRVPPEEVYSAMAGATATVFPSLWDEPFGRVTVESMLLGTPVVGSNVGGIAEVICDGETGLLFPPGDADALADRLYCLHIDKQLRARLSRAGESAAQQFTPDRIVEDHLKLYADILST